MSTMMKKARAASALRMSNAEGEAIIVPAGPLWVLERTSWVLLMWQSKSGSERAEIPVRDYSQHVRLGTIHPN